MAEGFVFFSELQEYTVEQREELEHRLLSDFEHVFLSYINMGNYLIIINLHDCFDNDITARILNQIHLIGLSDKWYDKQDIDLFNELCDEYTLTIDDISNSDAKMLIAYLLKYKSEHGEWDNVCQTCLDNDNYVRWLFNETITNENNDSLNELYKRAYYSLQEIHFGNQTNENNRRGDNMGTGMDFLDYNSTNDAGIATGSPNYGEPGQVVCENRYNGGYSVLQEQEHKMQSGHTEKVDKEVYSGTKEIRVKNVRKITVL